MADIFISYAHEDLATAEALDRELQSFGWTVWRDDRVRVSGIIDDQIQAELDRASCVVVIWSPSSIRSAWVKAEAEGGDDQGKLVPVSFHRDLSMPIRFRLIKTAMLSSPLLDPDEESAKGFLTELVRVTGKAPSAFEGATTGRQEPAGSGSGAVSAGNWALRAQTRRARYRNSPMNLRLFPDVSAVGDPARRNRWKDSDARHKYVGRWRFDLGSQSLNLELTGLGSNLDQMHAMTAIRVTVLAWEDRDMAVCTVDGGKGWTLERRVGV